MFFKSFVSLAAAASMSTIASAAIVSIDFEGGTPGAAVDDFYVSDGVTFANAKFRSAPTGDRTGGSGLVEIDSISGGVNFDAGDPIIGTFSADVSSIAINALDIGQDGARLEAYDINGVLVGSQQAVGPNDRNGGDDNSFQTFVVNSVGIRSFRLFQLNDATTDGLVFDDLVYDIADAEAVPEPGALGLLGLGLLTLGAYRRRSA